MHELHTKNGGAQVDTDREEFCCDTAQLRAAAVLAWIAAIVLSILSYLAWVTA